MANEDAIVVTEPTQLEVNPTESTVGGSRGVSGPIVNNVGGASETPATLVNDNLDLVTSKEELNKILIYKKDGSVFESKLPINPAHFGFTLQVFVDSLPAVQAATPDTLYVQKVKTDGLLVGYRLYRFNKEKGAFEQFGCTPDLALENGPREQHARVETFPQEQPEKVFNGLVIFNKIPLVRGRPLTNFINRFVVDNIKAIPDEIINQLQCGDIVVKRTVSEGVELFHTYIVSHRQATGICLTYTAAGYIETQSYDYTNGHWVYNSEDKWVAE